MNGTQTRYMQEGYWHNDERDKELEIVDIGSRLEYQEVTFEQQDWWLGVDGAEW